MPRRPPPGQPREAGVGLLAGVAVGTVIVLIVASAFAGPFRLAVSPARGGSLPELGCTAGHCVNFTLEFRGASSVDPAHLHLTVLPYDGSEILNKSAGAPLHFLYFPTAEPRWIGNLGGGSYSPLFGGDIVDPGGYLVGQGGPGSITSGAILCLRGNSTGPTLEYELAVEYDSVTVTIPFAVA